jgi:hypothetical protein
MYSIGLEKFIQAKKLSSKEVINLFLEHESITDFNANNHKKVNDYIQNNWNKFATFVDKSLKDGVVQGERIKLNTYFDEQKEFRDKCKIEESIISNEEMHLINIIKKYDDIIQFNKCHSFLNKRNVKLPSNQEGDSRKYKVLPKIKFILELGELKEELVKYLIG